MAMDPFFRAAIEKADAQSKFRGLYSQPDTGKIKTARGQRLYSFSAAISRDKRAFEAFESSMKKYASYMGIKKDVSFKSFMNLGVDALDKFPTPIKKIKSYYTGTKREQRLAYVAQMTHVVLQQHYKNLDAATKLRKQLINQGYNIGNVVPHKYLDINWYDGTKDGKLSLDQFLEAITSEANLAQQADIKTYTTAQTTSKKSGKSLGKEVKNTTWLGSWWNNIKYSLDQLGWSDVTELLDTLSEIADINTIYQSVFKSEDYNFVFLYNEDGSNSDKNRLLRDLDKFAKSINSKKYNKLINKNSDLKSAVNEAINDYVEV